MYPGTLIDWIALNHLVSLGTLQRIQALDRLGSPGEVAFRASASRLRKVVGVRSRKSLAGRLDRDRERLREVAAAELRRCRKLGISLLPLGDRNYPAALMEIADPPVLLYVLGDLAPADVRVAMVGSRRASSYGMRTASEIAHGLAARGVEVVSGGARGVDTSAHRGALQGEGRTLVVLGSGLDRIYPEDNRELFGKISRKGAILSEFPLNYSPKPENFPRRNRIISGLSAAIVVVEAASRSGSLITAGFALEQGREVMTVPGPVSSTLSDGCNRLIREGACLVRSASDVIDGLPYMYRSVLELPRSTETGGKRPRKTAKFTDDERIVADLLDPVDPMHLDDLADAAPMGIARLQVALFGLEVNGVVEHSPGRYYLLRPREES